MQCGCRYPAAIEADLGTDRPHAITILGKRLVLWQDDNGDWIAFEDRCPHRAVALSEGRFDASGRLQCAYHGWAFASARPPVQARRLAHLPVCVCRQCVLAALGHGGQVRRCCPAGGTFKVRAPLAHKAFSMKWTLLNANLHSVT